MCSTSFRNCSLGLGFVMPAVFRKYSYSRLRVLPRVDVNLDPLQDRYPVMILRVLLCRPRMFTPDHLPSPDGSCIPGPKTAVVQTPRVAVMDPPAWKVSFGGTSSTSRDGLAKCTFESLIPDDWIAALSSDRR